MVSGVGKLLSPGSGRRLLKHTAPFATRWVAGPLPWVELALAGCLVLTSGPLLTGVSAAVMTLFAAFTALVARGTRAPDPASCGCFGALSTAPVSWRTVVRNALFALVAALALGLCLTGFHGPVLDLPGSVLAAAAVPVALVLVSVWSEGAGRSPGGPRDVARVPPLPAHLRDDAAASSSPGSAPSAQSTAPGSYPPADAAAAQELDYERLPIPWAGL